MRGVILVEEFLFLSLISRSKSMPLRRNLLDKIQRYYLQGRQSIQYLAKSKIRGERVSPASGVHSH